jgi:hypothetical protein
MTYHPHDGHIFCGDYSFFHREKTFFRRIMSVNRRLVHVHRHDEHVRSVIAHSPRGIGRTQCPKESSREQNVSYCPRIGSITHRKLRVDCRIKSTFCDKRKAKSRVVKALRLSMFPHLSAAKRRTLERWLEKAVAAPSVAAVLDEPN